MSPCIRIGGGEEKLPVFHLIFVDDVGSIKSFLTEIVDPN